MRSSPQAGILVYLLGAENLFLVTQIGVWGGYYGISIIMGYQIAMIWAELSSTDYSWRRSRRWMIISELGHLLLLLGATESVWGIICRVTVLIHVFEAIAAPGFHANNK